MHTMIFKKNPKLLPVLASSSKKKKKLFLGSQKLEPEIRFWVWFLGKKNF